MSDFQIKLKNFWYYHKYHVLIAVIALGIAVYSFVPSAGTKADYHIGVVTDILCPEDRLSKIETRLSAAAGDVNGDGKVIVTLHAFTVDFDSSDPNSGYMNYEKVAALDADLSGKLSGLFIVEDPEGFQLATDGLLAEPFADFDGDLSVAVRKDAGDEYSGLLESLK